MGLDISIWAERWTDAGWEACYRRTDGPRRPRLLEFYLSISIGQTPKPLGKVDSKTDLIRNRRPRVIDRAALSTVDRKACQDVQRELHRDEHTHLANKLSFRSAGRLGIV